MTEGGCARARVGFPSRSCAASSALQKKLGRDVAVGHCLDVSPPFAARVWQQNRLFSGSIKREGRLEIDGMNYPCNRMRPTPGAPRGMASGPGLIHADHFWVPCASPPQGSIQPSVKPRARVARNKELHY